MKKEVQRTLFLYITAVSMLLLGGNINRVKMDLDHKAYAQVIISPLASEPTPTPTEKEQIIAYIKEVFGEDAPQAFKLLSCENARLNPLAVNTAGNTPRGSRDIGVFQINEYWQKTQAKFLFNWKINVQVAHQLFMENGKSFKLWTCGKK